jgi:hypothetical protein
MPYRGARLSPRHRLAAATPHRIVGETPPTFLPVPPQLQMWGNDVYGDCVTAEEAFAKAAYSTELKQPELVATTTDVITWARSRGFLDGADLISVIDAMSQQGFIINGRPYQDGTPSAVDWTNDANLTNAIAQGPVKIAVAADQLEPVVTNANGWLLQNATTDDNTDHCVSLCGYGTINDCLTALLAPTISPTNGSARGYLIFTWSTIGVIDQPSLLAICREAWLRSPTTVGLAPPNPTPPTPTPTPPPVPAPPCSRLRLATKHVKALFDLLTD